MNKDMLEKIEIEDQLTQNFITSAHSQFNSQEIEEMVKEDRDLRILMFALSTLLATQCTERHWWRRKNKILFDNYLDGLQAIAYVLTYISK